MEDRLLKRGITDPAAWIADHSGDIDTALAEAVTLAVDDVVLNDLLDVLARTPLARELVIGASVYRVPVDQTGLAWQVGEETEPVADADRDQRNARINAKINTALENRDSSEQLTLADVGLTEQEIATYQTDMQEQQRSPVPTPTGFASALSAALTTGLIAPVARSDADAQHLVHRWTARAIEKLHPDDTSNAHHRAARYWRWRLAVIPQSEADDIEQLLEARYHHHAASEPDAALELSSHTIVKLQTWGQYGRASELCRETLNWVEPNSAQAAAYLHQLGILAQLRGTTTPPSSATPNPSRSKSGSVTRPDWRSVTPRSGISQPIEGRRSGRSAIICKHW
jgi:hypothetical protein